MNVSHKIKTFTDRYPLVGPLIWILCVEYFIIQIIVALDWKYAYSITRNTISDLGNTSCGSYAGRYVCSPLHDLMNLAFICLGIFMMVGSLLIYQEFKETRLSLVGFSFMLFAGVGTVLVGIFPENTIAYLHGIGAFLPFIIGNIGIIILGYVLALPKTLRIYSVLTGFISLVALGFFIANIYLGIGEGGVERVVAYPQTIWLIVFGIYISKNHYSKLTTS